MPLLHLDLDIDAEPVCPSPQQIRSFLTGARSLPKGRPVVILLHGYRYSPMIGPSAVARCASGWPGALGFGGGRDVPGLCVPLGWHALGRFSEVYERAGRVGQALAVLLDALADDAPDRPVHILAHSLGARVALSALAAVRLQPVRKLILLAPAEFADMAVACLRSPGASRLEVLQVSPVENLLFDGLLSTLMGREGLGRVPLGFRKPDARNWTRLPVDRSGGLTHLARLGFPIGARNRPVCHWSAYLRGGLMDLYRTLLTDPDAPPFAFLQASEADGTRAGRWPAIPGRGYA